MKQATAIYADTGKPVEAGLQPEFFRADGTPVHNVVSSAIDEEKGIYVHHEILGLSGQKNIPTLLIKGKELYRRIILQPVYPYVKEKEN
ncbi:hypothetical protein [Treponema putidum]|uniref:hypothetical protein n=1 Tax=Treponema putidum TaxID=221027 RepID=UPI003D90160E